MKKRLLAIFFILVLTMTFVSACTSKTTTGDGEGDFIEIVDMANRTIRVPRKVEKILSTGPVGTILIYTLNPDKLLGWNYELREGEKQFIDEKYHDLPNFGGSGKNPLNYEEVLKADPDVVVTVGQIDNTSISEVEEMEEKIGMPVVILDSDMEKLDVTYELLGKIMGEEEKAKELGEYCRTTFKDIKTNSQKISEEMKVSIYYAEGPVGLETEPPNSWHGEVIDMIGGKNVAQVEISEDRGRTEVSLEQLLKWDPEIIISWDDERGGYYSGILEDPAWQEIQAVKNGEVFEIPNRPFNWFDRPPSVNRVLGLRWLGNLLYPEIYDYDIREEVREFYSKFYHHDLTEEELDDLLKNSTRQ